MWARAPPAAGAARPGPTSAQASAALASTTTVPTVRPTDSELTNASRTAAATSREASPGTTPAPSPCASVSRAAAGVPGSRASSLSRPTVVTSAPIAATPNVPPTMRDIVSTPEATPAFWRATEFIAAVLIGDMTQPIPSPRTTKDPTRKP